MRKRATKSKSGNRVVNLVAASEETDRKEMFWIKGRRKELDVCRVPTKFLYFNIENGRYADKMVQLRQEFPGVDIDPREKTWRDKIWQMLKGKYPGTDRDSEPFNKLREDLASRQQLRPGVVLSDGGVLDGNRRLAALLDLAQSRRNPSRYEFLDAVILDEDVGAEDRWRIEAGVQIGRDEKHPYSGINELLKIREGLRLFRSKSNPASEISKVLYGIGEEEIKEDVQKIQLIDEYLMFVGKPQAYNEVGDVLERFEEAIANLNHAKRLGLKPAQLQQVKVTQFALIRDSVMTNWEMRTIRRAMGGKSGKGKNERALNDLLKIGEDTKKVRSALATKGRHSPLQSLFSEKAEKFLGEMDAQKKADKPLILAETARSHLTTLLDGFAEGKVVRNADSLRKLRAVPPILQEIVQLSQSCLRKISRITKKSAAKM
jgi:hypothetical protein